MTRFYSVSLIVLMLSLAGCGEESTPRPTDGRPIDGVDNTSSGSYSGRVIDDYLKNARVWLDIDGDYQYTQGPLEVAVGDGITVTLEDGEPTAMTGNGGRFSLDTSALIRDPGEARSLDPRAYSLIAVTVPGLTEEETRSGNVVLDKAYMMSAPPGTQVVTPLTTLLNNDGILETGLFDLDNVLSVALANVNLRSDYVRSGDNRAQAYSRALARFMASQFPGFAADNLSDGTERVLGAPGLNLLRLSYISNAADVIALVDEAAAGGAYTNVDIDSLALPEVPLDLADPVILRQQRAEFETRTTCQPGLADTSEVGGEPEITYSWQMSEGRVTSITDGEKTLIPDYANQTSTSFGYTLTDSAGELERVSPEGPVASCFDAIDDEDLAQNRVISGQQPYTFSGYSPQPAGFPDLVSDWDVRDGNERLLRLPFLDPLVDQERQGT